MSSLETRLRAGAADQRSWVRAAVNLLIDFENVAMDQYWEVYDPFMSVCVVDDGHTRATIDWAKAREWFDSTESMDFPKRDRAVLDFVIALGENRFALGYFRDMEGDGGENGMRRALLVDTFRNAMGGD